VLTDNGANGQYSSYTYDADGNVATKADALGRSWSYTYNAQNQLVLINGPSSTVIKYGHDSGGNVSMVADLNGNNTDYTYDGFGNLTAQSSPDTGITTFDYDNLGRRLDMVRADSRSTSYSYDGLNRVWRIQAPDQNVTYSFDTCTNGKGYLCSVTDTSGSTAFTYRQNGQLASQVSTIGGSAYTISRTYDSRDRLSTLTYPSGDAVTYAYDTQSDVTGITANIGGTVQTVLSNIIYSTMSLGPVSSMTYGDGSISQFTYNSDLRLAGLSGLSQSYTYAYDKGGAFNCPKQYGQLSQ
jgi:YD repeat-containing protein